MKNKKDWIYKGVGKTKNIFGLTKYVHVYEHKTNKK